MINIMLIIMINIILISIVIEGIKYFNRQDRIKEAREKAIVQHRKSNGRFSKANFERVQITSIRKIRVNDYSQTYFI